MIAILDGRGMISIFPESPFPCFTLIKFLTGSPGNQFDGAWNNVTTLIIGDYKVNVVRCNGII